MSALKSASTWTTCALLVAAMTSARSAERDTASFHKPRAQILEEVRTVGVLPVEVDRIVPNRDAVARRYEQHVLERLRPLGFQLVAPEMMRGIRERLTRELGGLYDPMTGELVEAKVNAMHASADAEYNSSYRVDAYLRAQIVTRSAATQYDIAAWDGVRENITGQDRALPLFADMRFQTQALSLVVRLESRDGTPLYEASGGLQILRYAKPAGGLSVRRLSTDPKALVADPARDERALGLALDPLVSPGKAATPVQVSAAATIEPDEPEQGLRVPRAELLEKFKSVAIAPVGLDEFRQGEAVAMRYHEIIAAQLTRLGLRVVGGPELEQDWQGERAAAGGFFDAFTGERDEEKRGAARNRILEAFGKRHAFDAMVYPSIVRSEAGHTAGAARWNGVEEPIVAHRSRAGGAFAALEGKWAGEVPVLSLNLRVNDRQGNTLYGCSGGIQALARLGSGGQRVDVPESELFSDPARNERAVTIALKELAMEQLPKSKLMQMSKGLRDSRDASRACERFVSGFAVVELARD